MVDQMIKVGELVEINVLLPSDRKYCNINRISRLRAMLARLKLQEIGKANPLICS